MLDPLESSIDVTEERGSKRQLTEGKQWAKEACSGGKKGGAVAGRLGASVGACLLEKLPKLAAT